MENDGCFPLVGTQFRKASKDAERSKIRYSIPESNTFTMQENASVDCADTVQAAGMVCFQSFSPEFGKEAVIYLVDALLVSEKEQDKYGC